MTEVTIRQDLQIGKICQHVDAGWLQEALPVTRIEELLDTYQLWETREKRLNMEVMVYWLIALHLYPSLSQRRVYGKLVSALRTVRDDVAEQLPSASAFCYRREQLGSEILEELFHQFARPQATPQTPGAFWKEMRLMALDGTRESVPDTLANREAFQYSTDDEHNHSPYPQARLLLLVECGTHLICDAEISSCRDGEPTCARRLLPRFNWRDTLVMWDSNFHANRAIFEVREAGGHVLGPLRSTVLPHRWVTLSDGSQLVRIRRERGLRRGPEQLVRIISYTLTDSRFPGAGKKVYRLVTTLLDPFQYPAKDLAVLYHERWHVELVIDETRCDMRLSEQTLRSRTPEGVIQELYALLLAHVLVRTLMLQAATVAQIAPTELSFTETLRILDEHLAPLALVCPQRRRHLLTRMVQEIGQQRLPTQPVRIQARVLKRSRLRYAHKKPEHWHAIPFPLDLDLHQVIALVV
jgi:Insertion element 4 transposase N-terminal/Transposase DDE domain